MNFSIFILPPILTGISALTFGLFVLFKSRSLALNRSLFVVCLSMMIWQFGNAASWSAETAELCELWQRLLYIGVVFIPAAAYHFSVEFNGLEKQKGGVFLVYLFSPLLLLLDLRSNFVIGSREVAWGRHAVVGNGHTLFLLLWYLPLISAFYNFYYGYKTTDSPFERQRRRFALICFLIACLSSIDYIPNYGIPFPYPIGFIFLIFFFISITHAIAQYRLLDISLIIKKISIITFMCVTAAVVIYITPFYLRPYLYNILGGKWIFFPISVALLVGAGLYRLINFIRHMEEIELSKKFSYRPILKKEAERMSAARSIDEFLLYLVRDLSSLVRLDYVGVLIWDKHENKFILRKSHTRSEKRRKIPQGLALSTDDALIVELLRKRKFLVYSELKYYLAQEVSPEEGPFVSEVIMHMERLGAEIAIPCFCEDRLLAIVDIGHKLDLNDVVTQEDLELFSSLSNNIGRAIHDFKLKEEKIELIVASQHILITAIEAKDFYTRGHTERVANYSSLIGKRLEKQLRVYSNGFTNLNWAAQLHDLGKIGIPDSILLKDGRLNEQEWEVVKRHTIAGIKILNPMREWLGEDICAGVLHHHENFDGSGYPSNQRGEEIHLFARIIRVADAFDAMTSDRPYRSLLAKVKAIEELKRFNGTYFDPLIVDAMVGLYNDGEI